MCGLFFNKNNYLYKKLRLLFFMFGLCAVWWKVSCLYFVRLVYWFILSADVILVCAFGLCLGRSSLISLLSSSNFPPLLPAVCYPLIVPRLLLCYSLLIANTIVWFFGLVLWFGLVVYIQKTHPLESKCVYFVCVYFIVQLYNLYAQYPNTLVSLDALRLLLSLHLPKLLRGRHFL